MKTIKLFSLASVAFIGLAQPTWAGPHGGGGGFVGGGYFSGGGRSGGFVGGGSRAAPAFHSGFRATPAFRGSAAYFTGRSVSGFNASRFYYGRPAVTAHGFTALGNRPTPRIAGSTPPISSQQNRRALPARENTQVAATNRQPDRTGSIAGRNRISDSRSSTAANRQSFLKNHASEQHDANNWHRDWDRRHAHFHHDRVFVFVNGFWWGLYPWDYYPYYASGYPYDYYNSYPYDYYNGYPYDYYNGYDPNDYYQDSNDNDSANAASDQYASNPTVSAVQSKLATLGYYHGTIDGVLGDETEAAIARYQEDHDLSVTGTVTAATLQSLGLRQPAS
jgi:hypothetical protein